MLKEGTVTEIAALEASVLLPRLVSGTTSPLSAWTITKYWPGASAGTGAVTVSW